MDSTPRSPVDPRRVVEHVDGNAIAGLLDVFRGTDPLTLIVACGHCDAAAPLAEWPVERDADAAIFRCRSCTRTLATLLRRGEGVELRIVGGSVCSPSA